MQKQIDKKSIKNLFLKILFPNVTTISIDFSELDNKKQCLLCYIKKII